MMNVAIYRLVIGAYALGIRLFSLFDLKAKLFFAGRRGLMADISSRMLGEQRERIWMHCASLGEFEQGRPVIEDLKAKYSGYAIVLTFFSPSGYEVRKNYDGADYIFYLPVDSPANAEAFLDAVQPTLAIFVKYELWYFYLSALAQRGIKSLLISAVFSERHGFFKWYGGLQRRMLRMLTHITVQDKKSAELLNRIGIDSVTVAGDTRFDRVIRIAEQAEKVAEADAFCQGHKIIVAGSTWQADEQLLKATMQQLPPEWKMILVPHNVDASHLSEIERLYDGATVRLSEWQGRSDKRVLLVDSVGKLSRLYCYGTVAYIGGAFGKAGVHNVLEAAVYGVPCFYGPVFHQFLEAEELVKAGGARVVGSGEGFSDFLRKQESKLPEQGRAAGRYVASKAGATAVVMSCLAKLISHRWKL